jgi:hypothetical protein
MRLCLALNSVLVPTFALSRGRPDGTTSREMYGALEGIDRQLGIVPSPQVLEQLGVASTLPALSQCATVAHRQGASEGGRAAVAVQGCWHLGGCQHAGHEVVGGWGS